MTLRFFFGYAARESRGAAARLFFFVACLGLGVGAVVTVAGVGDGLEEGVRAQARPLLGGDLSLRSWHDLPDGVRAAVAAIPGARTVEMRELATVVSVVTADGTPGRSQLVELRAVDPGWPFYGAPVLEPPRPPDELLGSGRIVVAPDLMTRLGLSIGAPLKVGAATFRVSGAVVSEPDRVGGAFSFGPRVLLSRADFATTGLEGFGSRVARKLLVRLPGDASPKETEAAAAAIRAAAPADGEVRVESWHEAQPSLRAAIRRVDRFLALSALLSLLIGGVGIAQTIRAWIASRLDQLAILECLGLRPREVFTLYLGQALLLGAAGSLVGALGGTAVLAILPRFAGDLLPAGAFSPWQPMAMARGVALGVVIAGLFALPALAATRRVPPVRVLRRDAEPLPPPLATSILAAIALAAGVTGAAAVQSGSLVTGLLFSGALAASALLLALAAMGLVKLLGLLPREGLPFWFRHGLAAAARPGAGTVGSVVALGLGLLVVLGHALIHERLSVQLDSDLPKGAPTVFLLDIQPDQWPGVEQALKDGGAESIDSVPVVMARLRSVDGRTVEELAAREGKEGEERDRWAFTREQRLTWLAKLAPDNTITAGALWSSADPAEMSLEEEFAARLGATVGSKLAFDVQGVPLEFTVTSLRRVDWKTFGINFFFVCEPGSLDGAPHFRLAAARLPADAENRVQDAVAAVAPNVTMLRIREILERITSVFARIGAGVNALAAVAVVSGLVILFGAVATGQVRRGREAAILRALGARRGEVMARFAIEYALVGLVAAVVGVAGAMLLTSIVATRLLELSPSPPPPWLAAAIPAAMLLCVVAGLAASLPALRRRPIEALREE